MVLECWHLAVFCHRRCLISCRQRYLGWWEMLHAVSVRGMAPEIVRMGLCHYKSRKNAWKWEDECHLAVKCEMSISSSSQKTHDAIRTKAKILSRCLTPPVSLLSLLIGFYCPVVHWRRYKSPCITTWHWYCPHPQSRCISCEFQVSWLWVIQLF